MILPRRLEPGETQEPDEAEQWRPRMRRTWLWMIAIATISATALDGQDTVGDWRETLTAGTSTRLITGTFLRTDLQRATKEVVWQRDSLGRFKSTFIAVDKNVKLEV